MDGWNWTDVRIARVESRHITDLSSPWLVEFALLSGQPGRSGAPALDTHKIHSISKRTIGSEDEDDTPGSASLHNPSEDQDVLNPHQLLPAYMQHLALGGGVASGAAGHYVDRSIMPKISVRAEHTSLARQSDPEKRVHLTCLVTVEMPSRIPGLDPLSQQSLPTSVSQKSLPQQPHSAQNSQSTILGYQLTSQNMASANDAGTRERPASHSGTAITGGSSSNHQHHLGMQRQHQSPSSAASQDGNGSVFRRESNATAHTHGTEDFPTSPSVSTFSGAGHHHTPGNYRGPSSVQAHSSAGMEKSMSGMTSISSTGHGLSQTPATTASAGFTPHSTTASSFDEQDGHQPSASSAALSNGMNRVDSMPGYNTSMNMSAITLTAAAQEEKTREAHGPFADVFKDLQDRMMDWKGHEPSTFGSLRMYDSLSVKKDKNVREFVVYLFEEALLCVVDDRKRSGTSSAQAGDEEPKLRLKGRVFVKHMKQVEDTSSVSGGLSLTIHMVGLFIPAFKKPLVDLVMFISFLSHRRTIVSKVLSSSFLIARYWKYGDLKYKLSSTIIGHLSRAVPPSPQ